MTAGSRIEVRLISPDELAEPLGLLAEFLRDGEPVPPSFVEQLGRAVESGDLEVLEARAEVRLVGVAMLAFRPSVSLGVTFASVEDLYVKPDARRRGAGRALLEAVEERCKERSVSYVEVQTEEEAPFYEALGYERELGVRVLSRSYAFDC